MEVFTYNDYLKYRNIYFKLRNNTMRLEDNNQEYQVDKEHDKIFKAIFDNKKEVAQFINKALKLENEIKEEQLEKYNSSYITRNFQSQEADIVYKIKEKNVFFLIEHQSTIDYSMPYRILIYQMEIMRSAIEVSKIKTKEYKIPTVIPIVLYTGKQKWNAAQTLRDSQEIWEEGISTEPSKFNLVDINYLNKEELLEDDSFFSKVLLLEKANNSKEIIEALEKIMPKIKPEQKDLIKRIISLILVKKIGQEKAKELVKKMKGDEGNMLAVLEMIDKENQMYIDKRKRNRKRNRKKDRKRDWKTRRN